MTFIPDDARRRGTTSTADSTADAQQESGRSGAGAAMARSLPRSMPRTTAQLSRRVQRAASAGEPSAGGSVAEIAAHGTGGAGQRLPHLDVIQESFGLDYPLGGVRAHVGGAAAEASAALGAHAYASGDEVAFAATPDLHLAAHEAAHVMQQRAGVQLSSEVGAAGDRYEQHADRVADAVVRGEPAAAILGEMAAGVASAGVQRKAVQRQEGESGNLYDAFMGAFTPAQRFQMADHGDQLRQLRTAPHKQRLEFLAQVDEKRQIGLIRGLELPVAEKFRLIEALPELVKLLSTREIQELFDEPHGSKYAMDRTLYNLLTLGQQMQTLNQFSADRIARLYPNGTAAEHAALLSTLGDRDLAAMLAAWEEERVLGLVANVPPHVADRVRRLAKDAHPNIDVGLAEQGADDRAASAREAEEAETKGPAKRRSGGRTGPPVDEWKELPWEERRSAFEDARLEQRVRYLGAEPEFRSRLFRTLSSWDMVATLAAFSRTRHAQAQSLVRDLKADELLAAVFAADDAAALATIYPLISPTQRYLLLPAMTPAQLAVLLARTDDAAKQDLWVTVKSAASIDALTAAMRRLSDDELTTLHFQLDAPAQEELIAALPAERRGLFAREGE